MRSVNNENEMFIIICFSFELLKTPIINNFLMELYEKHIKNKSFLFQK